MKPSPCLCCLQTLIVAVKETRPSLPLPGSAWVGHSHHLDLLEPLILISCLSIETVSQSEIFSGYFKIIFSDYLDFKLYAMKSESA